MLQSPALRKRSFVRWLIFAHANQELLMQSKSLSIERPVSPEHKTLDLHKEKGCLNRVFKYLGLFKSENVLQKFEETKLSPYAINTNKVQGGKLIERELLIRANPLYGNKVTQKASQGTCVYYALNYIRTRYKQCAQQFQKERHIEKIFSKCRRKSINANLCLDRFKWIFNYWIRENKMEPDSSTTQEWIDFFSRQAEHPLVISNASCNKEKNDYLLSETYKHIFQFIKLLKDEKSSLPSSFTIEQLKMFIEQYGTFVIAMIRKNILEHDLKLNFPTLVKHFLEERGINQYSKDINEFINNSRSRLNMITEKIFFDPEAKLNGLGFHGRGITHSISALLDTIEENGPLICFSSANFAHQPKATFIKSVSNYPLSDLELVEDKRCEQPNHAMILVGGSIDVMSKEFVYLMDPNDTFTAQSKAPVYRIPFDKFKKTLVPYDSVSIEIDNESYFVVKNWFVYSKNGLNLTRDPIPKKEIVADSDNVKYFSLF